MPVFAGPTTPTGLRYTPRYLSVGEVFMASGAGALDENGTRWLLESVTGWDGFPAPVGESTPKVGTDGVWIGDQFYGPRLLEVVGSVQADWETANECISKLGQTIPISETVVAVVGGAGPDLQAEVRQNAEVLVTGNQTVTRFSMSLIAPDPRKYFTDLMTPFTGLPQTTGGLSLPLSLPLSVGATVISGRMTCQNDGDVATHPVLAIQGPCPACTITHLQTGRQLRIADPVPAGRTLYLDTDTKIALLDGIALRLVTGQWFDFDPGPNDIQFNASTYDAAAKLTAIYRSARR